MSYLQNEGRLPSLLNALHLAPGVPRANCLKNNSRLGKWTDCMAYSVYEMLPPKLSVYLVTTDYKKKLQK